MKNVKLSFGLFIIACFVFIGCATAKKEPAHENDLTEKFALIIGNTNYQNISKLQNPKNDAEDAANVLKQFGFNVELCLDLNYEQMELIIDKYIENLSGKNNTEGFFYFAGQGFNSSGNNYLIPVDFNPNNGNQIISGSYPMETLFKKLIKADNAPNVVIVDACFTEIPVTHRGIFASVNDDLPIENDGLELIDKFTKDIFYLQSALPGKAALDGGISDRNSPFARALLKNIIKPVKFIELVNDIIIDTLEYSNGQQKPYFKGNIFNYENYIINH
jgi:hypothetical protein